MSKYSCERCGKEFSQKSHYDSHKRRKKPCENYSNKIQSMVDKKVKETINDLNLKNLKKLPVLVPVRDMSHDIVVVRVAVCTVRLDITTPTITLRSNSLVLFIELTGIGLSAFYLVRHCNTMILKTIMVRSYNNLVTRWKDTL